MSDNQTKGIGCPGEIRCSVLVARELVYTDLSQSRTTVQGLAAGEMVKNLTYHTWLSLDDAWAESVASGNLFAVSPFASQNCFTQSANR